MLLYRFVSVIIVIIVAGATFEWNPIGKTGRIWVIVVAITARLEKGFDLLSLHFQYSSNLVEIGRNSSTVYIYIHTY